MPPHAVDTFPSLGYRSADSSARVGRPSTLNQQGLRQRNLGKELAYKKELVAQDLFPRQILMEDSQSHKARKNQREPFILSRQRSSFDRPIDVSW
jgi:hypothetical protein